MHVSDEENIARALIKRTAHKDGKHIWMADTRNKCVNYVGGQHDVSYVLLPPPQDTRGPKGARRGLSSERIENEKRQAGNVMMCCCCSAKTWNVHGRETWVCQAKAATWI